MRASSSARRIYFSLCCSCCLSLLSTWNPPGFHLFVGWCLLFERQVRSSRHVGRAELRAITPDFEGTCTSVYSIRSVLNVNPGADAPALNLSLSHRDARGEDVRRTAES